MKKTELIAKIERLESIISEQKCKEFGSKLDLVRSTLESIGMVKEEMQVTGDGYISMVIRTFTVTY